MKCFPPVTHGSSPQFAPHPLGGGSTPDDLSDFKAADIIQLLINASALGLESQWHNVLNRIQHFTWAEACTKEAAWQRSHIRPRTKQRVIVNFFYYPLPPHIQRGGGGVLSPLARPTASPPAAALSAPAVSIQGGNINAHIYRLFWFCCVGGESRFPWVKKGKEKM